MEFVDIHNHLAWGIDDGMPTEEDAMAALKQAKEDGITKIIATPHFVPGSQNLDDIEIMNHRIKDLKGLAHNYGILIYTGAEIFLNSDYLEMIEEGLFHTLGNSSYILVEFDVRRDMIQNDTADDKLYELIIREYTPIVAHVERYFPKGIDLDRVKNWIDMGCYVQINRTSILGLHGEMPKRNAFELLKRGLCHVIASDAHRATGSRITRLSDAYNVVKGNFGLENADLLFIRNPVSILENKELGHMVIKKKTLFDRFRKRGK